jgi:hypothetical protein
MMKKMQIGLLVALTSSLALGACGSQSPEPKSADAAQGDAPPPPPPGGPDGAGPGEHRAPPEEAFTACDGKKAEDACTVKHDNQDVEGLCKKGPKDDKLACMPKDGPKGGPGDGKGPPPQGEPPKS